MTYLVSKFAPGSSLYPTDVQQRATVDQLLYFDIGTLFRTEADLFYPVLFAGKEIDPEKNKMFRQKLAFLDGFLANRKYVAGTDKRTVADLTIFSTITFLSIVDYDLAEFGNVVAWRDRLANELPYHKEVNVEPLEQFKAALAQQKAAGE